MVMEISALHCLSPLDGRYSGKAERVARYFSEYALIRYRLMVEVEYLIALVEQEGIAPLADFPRQKFEVLRSLYLDFDDQSALQIKGIERQINHDVKAVEYFLKEALDGLGFSSWREMVHFGLTSQDINNTAFPYMLKDSVVMVYTPMLLDVVQAIEARAREWATIPMLARTHGQPASPTSLGKEMWVFTTRLRAQIALFQRIPIPAKFGGATGNFNAHRVAFPGIDWVSFANRFVNDRLGLQRSQCTTQIDNYDNLSAIFDCMRRINTVLIDFCRDVWSYISMDYFRQVVVPGEVGSSAMPHKVNPIDFENAEGNLMLANALYDFLSNKLPVSRLQRDLTDSTVIRNIGVPLGHTVVALQSILKGLQRISVHEEVIRVDLEHHWQVVAEGIQTVLRREGYQGAYETLKELTRTDPPPRQEDFLQFIAQLDISESVRQELLAITPFSYTGILPAEIG